MDERGSSGILLVICARCRRGWVPNEPKPREAWVLLGRFGWTVLPLQGQPSLWMASGTLRVEVHGPSPTRQILYPYPHPPPITDRKLCPHPSSVGTPVLARQPAKSLSLGGLGWRVVTEAPGIEGFAARSLSLGGWLGCWVSMPRWLGRSRLLRSSARARAGGGAASQAHGGAASQGDWGSWGLGEVAAVAWCAGYGWEE